MQSKEEKPPWDSSQAGQPAALTTPPNDDELGVATRVRDQILSEAGALAGSASRGLMTKDQKLVESARSREQTHRANLELFLSLLEKDESQIFAHRESLAVALYQQGKFDEALMAISVLAGHALEGFADLVSRILAYREAVWREDSEECGCEPIRKTIEVGANKTVEIQERRCVDIEPILSPKHGRLVNLWQCSLCGFLNAHSQLPVIQSRLREQRSLVERMPGNPALETGDSRVLRLITADSP
jgi:hypothetical protein